MDWTALIVFIALFVGVNVVDFFAARWRRGDLHLLNEWDSRGGASARSSRGFCLGGDIYTAYTFIAVPALMFGAGAIGFFAVPYTIIIYPFAFLVFPKLWQVAKRHGFVTASDFIRALWQLHACAGGSDYRHCLDAEYRRRRHRYRGRARLASAAGKDETRPADYREPGGVAA